MKPIENTASPSASAHGYATWLEWIESTVSSADRYGDGDVVPAMMARELAARLDECHIMQKILIKGLSHNAQAQRPEASNEM